MNKLYLASLIGFFILGITACSKYDPIYGVAGNTTVEGPALTKDLVYIFDNDIYLTNVILTEEKRLTFSPNSTKTHIALSPNHDRVAYLDANGTPVIIDTLGNPIETLPYSNVKDMKYHANNGNPILYMLRNNIILFYPSSLNISSNPFHFVFPTDATYEAIDAIDINEDLDVIFSFRYQKPYSPGSSLRNYYHGAGTNYSGTNSDKSAEINDGFYNAATTSYTAQNYPYYHMIKFNEEFQNASLGYIQAGSESSPLNYALQSYVYGGSTPYISSLSVMSLSAENYYTEYNEGYVATNEGQIQKYLKVLPLGVPPTTGNSNIFTINFPSSNNSHPTYFDWNP
jgi:hypothetical protein